jgi:hypothetical protein
MRTKRILRSTAPALFKGLAFLALMAETASISVLSGGEQGMAPLFVACESRRSISKRGGWGGRERRREQKQRRKKKNPPNGQVGC